MTDSIGRARSSGRGYALVGTLVLALLAPFLPVRRAVHFRPGDALRYA